MKGVIRQNKDLMKDCLKHKKNNDDAKKKAVNLKCQF